ncbi:pannexin-1-like [Oncorhynchus masou masou]|uniref:pannexin-1-like n=1 Tax=Oncorhynchus masou masou TaxID=90313 RepID=UPI0031833488
MAIAHVATEYVFSDFLLKEPGQARYRAVRTELAMDKMVTCVAVGLPLLLISLAFAQEVSVGVQISCFPPANFSWRQAMYVDSYCWAALHTHTLPLWLHKFFPYILLLVAVIMYSPAVFWRFSASPLLQSDLSFIIEELDRCYNRAVTLAKRMATAGEHTDSGASDPTEGCFMYPVVEQYLLTKRRSVVVLWRYLLCRGLNLLTLLLACVYLGYYLRLASLTDQFGCSLRTGLLANDTSIPDQLQCKLVAVGVFTLLSFVNLLVYAMLVPVVIYSALRPFFQSHTHFLKSYQSLPTISVLPLPQGQWDDLTLYFLFLEENLSELKSYKYMKVLELLRRRGVCEGEDFDAMGLLQMLCLVKTDVTDGKRSTAATFNASDKTTNANASLDAKANDNPIAQVSHIANANPAAGEAISKAPTPSPAFPDSCHSQTSATEMTEFSALLPGNSAMTGGRQSNEGAVQQRII